MKFTLTATILTLIAYLGRVSSRSVKTKSAPDLCGTCSGGKGKGRGGKREGKGKGSSCSQPDIIECGGEVRMMHENLFDFD